MSPWLRGGQAAARAGRRLRATCRHARTSVGVNGLQYGFAYDDDNGQSSDFNSTDAQYVQVAIGW